VQEDLAKNIGPKWGADVQYAKDLLLRGREASEQINILGDDGVPVEYHVRYWKSELIDFVILQQDGFDPVDRSTPMDRQKFMLELVLGICRMEFDFDSFEQVNPYFKKLINIMKQMNYAEYQSAKFEQFNRELKEALSEREVANAV
jgi:V/A-type H+/Na+-transporting ATPase subunit A